MWYLWTAPNSPLYGRDKMTTFERYFLAEKETWTEVKNAYYRLIEKEETADRILQDAGIPTRESVATACSVPPCS